MCEVCAPSGQTGRSLTRRGLFAASSAALGVGLAIGTFDRGVSVFADEVVTAPLRLADGLDVLPRAAWGVDLPPKGPMGVEDVRFLLVHHTFTSNTIPSQRNLIRSIHSFHTGPEKRWNDVAYNFFIGPDGTVWEGRAGSLDGPVVADATGGSQGYAQLVCLLGNFTDVAPPAAMQNSLVALLAQLAIRYRLSTWKDAQATFVSRGSNKLPAGRPVSLSTISGHRDVTDTECPGDQAYGLLGDWRRRVHPIVAASWQQSGTQPAVRRSLQAP